MSWKPYPDYKDSGIEWLGEIPAHWAIKRLKHITQCLDGKRIPLNAEQRGIMKGDYPYWGANGIVDHVNQWLFDEELVLLGEDGAPFFEPFKDVAFFVSGKIWVNNHAHVLRPLKGTNPRYLTHLLNSVHYRAFIDGSTRDKLTQGAMNDIPTQFPPMDEQDAITAFLDREIERIDTLITKKERQIELLQEKRAALISHTVTKGINPNAKMKNSGIEWIGYIPEHWEVIRLKYAFVLFRGFDLASDKFIIGPFPVCGSNGIIGYHDQYTTVGPSITVGRSGSVGEVNFYKGNFWAHNTALYVKDFIRSDPRFTYYLLKTLDLKSLSAGSAVGTLNRNYIHDLPIAIPASPEQKNIAEYLGRETGRIDTLIEKVQESISVILEYRAALISAMVTGKIDVRKEVA